MTLGLIGFGGVLGYIAYMRSKYESQGYYAALQEDGTEVYAKRRSKWEWWDGCDANVYKEKPPRFWFVIKFLFN